MKEIKSIQMKCDSRELKVLAHGKGIKGLKPIDSSHILIVVLPCYQVFLAMDDDGAPIICFLLQGQKKLLSVRLQSIEINNEIHFDVKPDMSWSIPAVSAAPVIVTRPG